MQVAEASLRTHPSASWKDPLARFFFMMIATHPGPPACHFFAQGACRNGDKCPFSHSGAAPGQPAYQTPSASSYQTPPPRAAPTTFPSTPAAAGHSVAGRAGSDYHAASQVEADELDVEYCVVRGRRSRVRGSVEDLRDEPPRYQPSEPPLALREQILPLLPLRIRWDATLAAWRVLQTEE